MSKIFDLQIALDVWTVAQWPELATWQGLSTVVVFR